ncbi:retrovirus-related pol polyprotein from transposon TNT 1-94 [Tanacetum coccineum]
MKETNADLTIKLARYKNQEKCFEISQEKYDKLERCYQKSVYQEQCLTKKINALLLSSAKTITTLNEEIANLNNQFSKEKSIVSSLQEEKQKLKSDFKIREDELLDKQIQLENKIKELYNILVKTGQSIQTMHMLAPNPYSFYHTEQKMALGYQNPFYLKQAQQKQQSLYNEAAKFVRDFKSLAKEADESLAKHKTLEFEIERLLRAVVSQDIMSIVQSNSVIDTSNLKTELDSYNDMQQKIERLQARLGDFKGKSQDTPCVSKTLDPLSQKLENENVELETSQKVIPKVIETNDLSKPVTSNSVPTPTESKVVTNDKTSLLRPEGHSLGEIQRMIGSFLRLRVVASRIKKVEVEEHHRNLLLSKNKKHMSSECNNVKLAIWNDKSEVICPMCKQCLITSNHDVYVLNYVNGMNSRVNNLYANISKTVNQKKHKPTVTKPKKVGSKERIASPKPRKPITCIRWSPSGRMFDIKGKIIESNESESQSDSSNSDNAYLEVAFRRNTCFVKNLEGVNLLKENCTTNLYTINLHEMASASSICLMVRATSTKKKAKKASHPPKPIPNYKQMLHLLHMDLCGPMRVESINEKRYILVIVDDYSRYTWVHFLRSKDEAPKEIKTFLKKITVLLQAPVFILINKRKLDISFLHVFGALCYPKNDRKDIGKLGAKGLDLNYAPSTITTQKPTKRELDLLFEAMYDDYIGGQPSAATRTAPAALAPQDHPLEQVIGEPSRPVLTRNQLRTDGNMCIYALTVSTMEPRNVKEAMNDPTRIDSMQEELLEFKMLDVWVLVHALDNIKPLTLKWLFKNKHDEENTIIQNKTHLVVRGYR